MTIVDQAVGDVQVDRRIGLERRSGFWTARGLVVLAFDQCGFGLRLLEGRDFWERVARAWYLAEPGVRRSASADGIIGAWKLKEPVAAMTIVFEVSPPNENLTRDIASSSNRRDRRPDPTAAELDAFARRPAPLRCSLTVVRAKSPGCADAELG